MNQVVPLGQANRLTWLKPLSPFARSLLYFLILAPVAAWAIFWRLGDGDLGVDEGIYAEVVDHMHHSGDWTRLHKYEKSYLNKPPLYFWLTAATYDFFEDGTLRYRFWSAVFGLGCVLLTLVIGARAVSPEAGFLGAAGLLANKQFLWIHGVKTGCMDSAITFFVLLCIGLYACWNRSSLSKWFLIGLCGAAISLLKPLFGIPVLVVLGAYHLVLDRGAGLRTRIIHCGLALGICVTVGAMWYLLQAIVVDPALPGTVLYRTTFGRAQGDVGGFKPADLYLRSVSGSSMLFHLFIPAVLAGLGWCIRRPDNVLFRVSVLFACAWIALLSISASKTARYVYPAYPLVAIVIAWFITALPASLTELSTRTAKLARFFRVGGAAAGIVLALVCLGDALADNARPRTPFTRRFVPWQIYGRLLPALEQGEAKFIYYRFEELHVGPPHWFYWRRMDHMMKLTDPGQLQELVRGSACPTVVVLPRCFLDDLREGYVLFEWSNKGEFIGMNEVEYVIAIYSKSDSVDKLVKEVPGLRARRGQMEDAWGRSRALMTGSHEP